MKKFLLLVNAILFFVFMGFSQELPRPSSGAEVKQRIGLTDITVKYSRPNVKGRTIWGDLVPYNEIWRLGANENTTIEFLDAVKINGKELANGKYSMFATPTETEWTIHFNSVTDSWGANGYKADNDVLTIKVKPTEGKAVESMRFTFENIGAEKGELVFAWENLRFSLTINVDVATKAMSNIETAIKNAKEEDKWKVYRNAANYCAESKTNLKKGLKWINESIKLKETWYSYWVKADVLAAMGNKKDAIESANKAIEIGTKESEGKEFKYKKQLEAAIEGWK